MTKAAVSTRLENKYVIIREICNLEDTTPTAEDLRERKGAVMSLFERLLPIVDGIADSFRFATLLGLGLVVWVFVWMLKFGDFSTGTSLFSCALISLPVLVLSRFWWGLEGLKKLPEVVASMISGSGADVREQVQGIRAAEKKSGLIGSASRLWELRSMAGEARELLGSYVRVGSLVNPVSLTLGFISLLFVCGLGLAGIVLAVIALV